MRPWKSDEELLTRVSPFRWVICGLLFLATTINYMDRQVLGLLAPTLEREIHWSETEYSYLVMAFQTAYALGLLGFGRLIDTVGTRHGYAISIALWSAAAAMHGAAKSVFGFGAARFALGLGEAGSFPAAVKAVAEWFPQRERALATGLFNSGSNVGALVAPVVVPWLTIACGWQASFVILGLTGFLWLGLWYALYHTPGPAEPPGFAGRPSLPDAEDTPPELPAPAPMGWREVLRHRQAWAFMVGMAFSAPVWWFYLYWLPKYLNHTYQLDLSGLGPPLVIVYALACVGSIGGGAISSALLARGWSLNASRKTAMLVCALAALPVMFSACVSNPWLSAGLIGLAAAAHQGWAANLYTLVSDTFPRHAVASVVGVGTMCGAVASLAFSLSAGRILQATGSYWPLFAACSVAYVAALAILQALLPEITPLKDAQQGR